jgi:hypothetical protein
VAAEEKEMRICFIMAAVFALAAAASAAERDRPTAIVVSPIHEGQIVRADDGKDHVEYELLVINVFPEAVTLSSVTVLNLTGKELMRIEGGALAAATQTFFARTQTAVIPASAAVATRERARSCANEGADPRRSLTGDDIATSGKPCLASYRPPFLPPVVPRPVRGGGRYLYSLTLRSRPPTDAATLTVSADGAD